MRRYANAFDVIAAAAALFGLASTSKAPSWIAVLALVLAVGAAILRGRSTVIRDRGLDARRKSLRAFAAGEDIAAVDVVAAEAGMGWRGGRLRTSISDDVDAYYAPATDAGPLRLRELVAYAAHFTKRLLRVQMVAAGGAALVLGGAGCLAVFGFIIDPPSLDLQRPIFDAVLGTLLGVLCVRVAYHAFESWRASEQVRPSAEQLAAPRKLARAEIDSLVTKYELHVQTAPEPWTWIYEAMRPTLEREWIAIRADLSKGNP